MAETGAYQEVPGRVRRSTREAGYSVSNSCPNEATGTVAEGACKALWLNAGVVSRAADPSYGKSHDQHARKNRGRVDVAFVGRFVPFSDLPPWFDRLYEGEGFYVETFAEEDARRRALAQAADGVAVAEFATIPETSQTVIGLPLPDFITPQVLNTPSMERIDQVRHPNEQLERIRDSVPVTMLKSELPVRAQERVKEIAYA